jgi:hypothetical protein
MGTRLKRAKGVLEDTWSKVAHDQADRTGLSALRVATSLKKGVHEDVVALQLNRNQKQNNPAAPITFTGDDVLAVKKFYEANKRRVAYTGPQAVEIDQNQAVLDKGEQIDTEGGLTC